MTLETALAGLFGLLIGSFLNVCIYRLPLDRSVVGPRSYCPKCGKTIAWYDTIPVLSWVLLRGRCRHCAQSISWRYPVVELLTAGFFAAAVAGHTLSLAAGKWAVFAALLIGSIFADLEERILPNEFTLGGLGAGLVFAAFLPIDSIVARLILPPDWPMAAVSILDALIGAAFAAGSLWLVGEAYLRLRGKEGLGFGDVKLVAMIGSFLGLMPTLLALTLGSMAGSMVGIAYIALTRRDASTYELPFGTFLGAGALVVAFFGTPLLAWYQRVVGL